MMAEPGTNSLNLNGEWKFHGQNNMEKFLEENGVGYLKRKMALATTPQLKIEHDERHFHIEIKTVVKNKVWDFNIGESFDEVAEVGKYEVVVSSRIEDGKMVMEFTPKKEGQGKLVKQTRHIKDGKLVQTMTVGDVEATREFIKVG